ncbi:hypothetical protein T07_3715 [Trichinella nelsoni]|uniref:Uncharacterized protein n=1 Tax=Trichinella nelsoni TaxID=6336 RepID=A0A0V0RWM8_9BILA|nr:hypothetical protein T07_3715 [Trichinella nelsoni]
MNCNVKSRNSKQQIHRKHWILKNKDNKHVNGGSSECTIILSVMYHRNVIGRFSSDLQALLIAYFIRRVSFVNNGWRELKETPWSNRKIPCQEIIDHRAIEHSVSTNHVWRERKETTRANFRRNAKRHTTTLVKSRNSKQQIHRKHFLLKNKDNKHVNVILSVMHHRNVSGRFSSDLRALLITGFIVRVSFGNNGWRELKETWSSNWKIPCHAIMFGVSEKRLLGQMLDAMLSDTPPR